MNQVNKDHYNFKNYINIDRWSSYYYQILYAMDDNITNILLIGKGDNVVSNVLNGLGKKVTTFDIDSSLNPDIVGDIKKLNKYIKKKYDLIICCQVLEHIEFGYFENIIENFKKYSDNIILSLPYNKIRFSIKMHLPKLGDYSFKIFIHKFWINNWRIEKEGYNEHYWEVGIKSYSKKKIRNILKKYFNITKEFIPVENTKHIFYILKK